MCKEKSWIFHQDNAPAHSALSVKRFLAKHNIPVLEHPPYSPDLAPCDFYLFPKLLTKVSAILDTQLLCKSRLSNTLTQIKYELDSVYGDSAPSFTTVKFWAAEFKRGRKILGDDGRSGRPNTATTDENIAKVHQMVLEDHRIKGRDIAEILNM
ncbi:HTH_48 domain-containing protein [Trichonephila clavipes]|uniref:HTH_48 domain-containing protein n=1 Tax=Trichonephila clavipes TaxID=2585209 RepID=A0A8X6RT96_TRICX|nr:HTH_48 domain-containing protein [Trichonephila clavipes]